MKFDFLRDYQKNCVQRLREGVRDGHNNQVLVAPTGSGKTVIGSYLLGEAHNKSSVAFFVCDRVALVDQTSATLDAYGVPHGVIQADHWRARPWEYIQVVSAQTLARRDLPMVPRLLLWDECFVAGSMVMTTSGPKPIEFVTSGELVYNATGIGSVVSVSAKQIGKKKLLKVGFDDGSEIRCTEDHPFFTESGWVKAAKLAGKSVFGIKDMPALWASFYPATASAPNRNTAVSVGKKLVGKKDLLKILLKEANQSNALIGREAEDGCDFEKNGSSPSVERRKRNRPNSATIGAIQAAWRWVEDGTCGFNRTWGESKRILNALQNRSCASRENDSHRSGRRKSLLVAAKNDGQEKGRLSRVSRVVSVEVVECGSHEVVYNMHVSGHPSYFVDGKLVHNCHTMYQSVLNYTQNKNIKVIGLTATPFTKGMGEVFTNVVNSITTNRLVEEGWLVPVKYYAAKEIDMKGAALKFDGEWKESEIEERGIKIVGDIVEEWIGKTHQYFGKPEKTIVFSATVAHGDELCRQFQTRGFNFQQISYKDGNGEARRKLIEEFRKPDSEITGLVSCEALAKGFDVTDIRIGIGARPYRKSLSGHIQQLGRVMRSHPGKDFALWLDHAGNVLRFMEDTQDVFDNGVSDLKAKQYDAKARKEPEEREKEVLKCSRCGYVTKARICPSCGHERAASRSQVENASGELVEITAGKKVKAHEWQKDKKLVWKELCVIANEIKNGKRFDAEKLALAHYRSIYGVWPQTTFNVDGSVMPRREVRNKVRSLIVAYRNRLRKDPYESKKLA